MGQCSITDCTDEVRARGLCPRHYGRWQRHGTTDKIPRKWAPATKICNCCDTEKSIDDFYSSNRGICKRCCSILKTCRMFKISYATFRAWLNQQGNRCAVCDLTFDDTRRESTPCLDHDHKTGKPRGFVCHRCNLLLGVLEKLGKQLTPAVLTAAQNYLATPFLR